MFRLLFFQQREGGLMEVSIDAAAHRYILSKNKAGIIVLSAMEQPGGT